MAPSSGYFLWATAGNPNSVPIAMVGQAVIYALATRLGAPGRDRYMLVLTRRHRARRRLGDGDHRRNRRRVPRPCRDPRRGVPHDGSRRPAARARNGGRGRGAPPTHPGRAGAPSTGAAPGIGELRAAVAEPGRAPRSRAPPAACTSTSRSASRIVPYCDFVVVAGRDARGPTNRIDDVRRRAGTGADAPRRCPRRAVGRSRAPPGRPWTRSTSEAARRASCRQRPSRACSTLSARGSASRPTPR